MTPEQTIRSILPGPDADAVLEALAGEGWEFTKKPERCQSRAETSRDETSLDLGVPTPPGFSEPRPLQPVGSTR